MLLSPISNKKWERWISSMLKRLLRVCLLKMWCSALRKIFSDLDLIGPPEQQLWKIACWFLNLIYRITKKASTTCFGLVFQPNLRVPLRRSIRFRWLMCRPINSSWCVLFFPFHIFSGDSFDFPLSLSHLILIVLFPVSNSVCAFRYTGRIGNIGNR